MLFRAFCIRDLEGWSQLLRDTQLLRESEFGLLTAIPTFGTMFERELLLIWAWELPFPQDGGSPVERDEEADTDRVGKGLIGPAYHPVSA